MATSAEIWILSRLAELSQRCGLSPVDAEIDLWNRTAEHADDDDFYALSLIGERGMFLEEDKNAKFLTVRSLLGLDEFGSRRFGNLNEVAEAVDRALSLAPRLPPKPRDR